MRTTASGMRFRTREEEAKGKTMTAMEKRAFDERMAFVKACPAYGLSPDFYGAGCLIDEQVFFLTALSDDYAIISSIIGTKTTLPYEEALDKMIAAEKADASEITAKAILLGYDPTIVPEGREMVRQARKASKNRVHMLERAKTIYNAHMAEVLQDMNLPEEAYGMGCKMNGKDYEFVSYRTNTARPYILESLCNLPGSDNHYKTVCFNTLKEAMTLYAEENEDGTAMELIQQMQPVAHVYEVEIPSKEERQCAASAFEQLMLHFA